MQVVENKDDDEVPNTTAYMLGDYEIDIKRIDFYVLSTHAPLQQDIKVEVYYIFHFSSKKYRMAQILIENT